MTHTLYDDLLEAAERPAAFSRMTIASLWADPHVAEQMLRFHLDGSVDIASHRATFIDAATAWITEHFRLGPGSRVLDLGCGPGLYTSRLARTGAEVTGVDFSARSIAHARAEADRLGLDVTYLEADYLAVELDDAFDLATLIMRDYGAMSPGQRAGLAAKVRRWLAPGGAFVLDVDSMAALADRADSTAWSFAPDGGFWSAEPHFELRASFVYPEEAAALDRYTIVEPNRRRDILNWTQYFTTGSLADELAAAGLRVDECLGDVAGSPFDAESRQFAAVVRAR